jgi:hypothetical protein
MTKKIKNNNMNTIPVNGLINARMNANAHIIAMIGQYIINVTTKLYIAKNIRPKQFLIASHICLIHIL